MFEAVLGQRLDLLVLVLRRDRVRVLVLSEVLLPIERLRVSLFPGRNLVGVYVDCAALDPGLELLQDLLVVVGTDARAPFVVPVVGSFNVHRAPKCRSPLLPAG